MGACSCAEHEAHDLIHRNPAVGLQKRLLPKPVEQDDGRDNSSKVAQQGQEEVVDLRKLNRQQRRLIVDNALATNEQSNEVLLEKYAGRADKWGLLNASVLCLSAARKHICVTSVSA